MELEARVDRLEASRMEMGERLARMEVRVEHIDETMVTKADLAEFRADMFAGFADVKTSVLETRAAFSDAKADFRKDLNQQLWRVIALLAVIVGGVWWLATHTDKIHF